MKTEERHNPARAVRVTGKKESNISISVYPDPPAGGEGLKSFRNGMQEKEKKALVVRHDEQPAIVLTDYGAVKRGSQNSSREF